MSGKNAIVTGGALGIGFGIVKRLTEAGANVLIADMNEDAAKASAEKLGERVAAMKADVSQDAEGIVARCVEIFGSLDIFVNNAGIYPMSLMAETSTDLFDKVYQVNLKGTAFCAKAAAQQMINQGSGGKIINVASIDSFHPSMVGLAAYDASKGGVLMLTKSLALEYAAHNVLVNGIAPGGILTEGAGAGKMDEAMISGFASRIPLQRMGTPDDVAKVALFLASDAADYMTGSIIVVDGGVLLA